MKKLLQCVLLLSMFVDFKAQERKIDEVELTGKLVNLPFKKSNVNITVITKSEILNAPAQSVEEVIAYYTGVDIRKRGANGVQTDLSIRGSSFEQVLLLVNGIRINDAQTGHNTMNVPFDLASVEKIEILKGPAARRYGLGNAFAGVINIVTKTSTENNVIINGEAGDFGTHGFGVASNFGGENFRNFIQVSNTESDGYRYNTDYKINNIWYQNQLNIKNGSVKLQAGIQEKKFGANGFYASPNFKDQYEEVQTSLVAVSVEKKLNNNFGFGTRAYWRRAQDMYLFLRNNPSYYRNMHIGNNVGIDANANYKTFLGITGFGADVRKEFLESNRLGSRQRVVTNAFLEHHFSLFKQSLNITPGISYTNIDAKNIFLPGIDVSYTEENNKVFANFAKVSRVPTYTDLFYVSPSEEGNSNLLAETALSGELGYQLKENENFVKYSFFWRKTDNAIDWQKATPSSKWTAQNIGTIDTKGFELEANYQIKPWIGTSIGYTYTDSKRLNKEVISRYSLENLKHQFVAKLRNKLGAFSNELIYRHNERVSLGSYNLLDDKINYNVNNLTIYVLINNITNTKYTETSLVEMPGTWFNLGFTYKFGL